TSLGFVLEARTLRPDMILTATVVVALLCWQSAERGGARRARWLAGLYAALGVGVLAKGLVPLVLVGLPIAAVTLRDDGWRGAAPGAAPAARGTFLLWAWGGGLLLFFSCAPSRLEHYAIPALPAAALLAARAWQRARAGGLGHAAWVYLLVGGALVAGVGVAGLLAGRAVLAHTYWLVQV